MWVHQLALVVLVAGSLTLATGHCVAIELTDECDSDHAAVTCKSEGCVGPVLEYGSFFSASFFKKVSQRPRSIPGSIPAATTSWLCRARRLRVTTSPTRFGFVRGAHKRLRHQRYVLGTHLRRPDKGIRAVAASDTLNIHL